MRAHFCSIDGQVLLGGGAFGGAGVQALLSGVYAGVFFVYNRYDFLAGAVGICSAYNICTKK